MTHWLHFFHHDEWKCRQQNVSQDRQLKENRENAEPGTVRFVFAFKKHITELLGFFFFFFTSVICDPFACSAKIFWLFFSGKPVGGWVWRSQELTKYQQMLERVRGVSLAAQSEAYPTSHPPRLLGEGLERIRQSSWRKSRGTLPVPGPSGLCLPEDALSTVGNNSIVLWSQATWFDSKSITESKPTVYHPGGFWWAPSEPVSSSVIEIIEPTSSDVLELNKALGRKYLAHCQTPD